MTRIIAVVKLKRSSGNKSPGGGKVRNFMGSGLWILILEGAIAVGLLLFIVWWTLPRGGKDKRPKDKQ